MSVRDIVIKYIILEINVFDRKTWTFC